VTSDELDQTERGRILQVVRGELSFPRVGRVVTVWPHTGAEDRPSNHEVDVAIPPGEPVQEPRRVPILQPTGGAAYVPREGDLVLVGYLRGSGDRPIVLGSVYGDADADRAPLASESDIRATRGSLYTELAGDGSYARIAKKPDDLEAPTATVEIDAQGTITLDTDGDVTVSAGGDVVIDEGGEAAPVAKQNHTHPYDWTDGGGSGDTGTPNESGTATEIE
jgi:hypothetical protein